MAGCISFVAIFAVSGVGAVFADPWTKTTATTGPDELEAGERAGPARAPVFSFGLENASYASAGPTGEDGNATRR